MLGWNSYRVLSAAVFAFGLSIGVGSASLACDTTHVVRKGDTLGELAQRYMGTIVAAPILHDMNRDVIGHNAHRLEIGQVLRLPCDAHADPGQTWTALMSPQDVHALRTAQPDLQIIDIRKAKRLADGRVPGSVSVPYAWFRGPKDDPGRPPSAERLARTLGLTGIDLAKPTIIVNHQGNAYQTGQAAYIYWILKAAGMEQLAILRGGFNAWKKSDMPVAYRSAAVQPYRARVTYRDNWWADQIDVFSIATDQVPGALLDARPHAFFDRLKKAGKTATTLPSAEHLPLSSMAALLSGDVDVAEGVRVVTQSVRDKGVLLNKDLVVSFCHTGEFAALNWFYLSELAGVGNVRLYPESAKGWETMGGLMTTVSQRFFE